MEKSPITGIEVPGMSLVKKEQESERGTGEDVRPETR